MKLNYHAETESLYIGLADRCGADCLEIHDGVVLDFDADGVLVGVDIDRVSSLPEGLKIPDRIATPPGSSDD